MLIQSQLVWAGDEEYVSSLKECHCSAASLVTADAWYSHMLNNNDWEDRLPTDPKSKVYDLSKRFTNVQVDGYVSLRWEGSEEVVFSSDWGYRVEVEIQSWNTQGHPMPTVTRWLAVNYELITNKALRIGMFFILWCGSIGGSSFNYRIYRCQWYHQYAYSSACHEGGFVFRK